MQKDYKTTELTALYEISKLLGSSLNLRANLRGVMRVLAEYLEMNRGTVALRSDNELSIIAAHGMSEEEIRRGRYKLGEGIIGRVAKLGSPIVVPNIGEEPLFLNKTGARRTITRENIAFLCVPIKFKNEVLGVLSVDRLFVSRAVSFEADLRLLKIIASLVAQSVKLHREVEKEREAFLEEKENLKRQLKGKYKVENIIGQSDSMQEAFEAIHRVAPSRANVLLRGESGTGKELVAKAIHANSRRRYMPMVILNCGALPEGILESELFGHEKGAFTGAQYRRKGKFELADGGTLFLDEIGDISQKMQMDLLRVLDEKKIRRIGGEKEITVDFRLIAATNKDLEAGVESGAFRTDLYYRLNVFIIHIPPLRERRSDIPLLAEHFLKKYSQTTNKYIDSIAPDALDKLVNQPWPGNVRELENAIERAVVVCKSNTIRADHLPFGSSQPLNNSAGKTLEDIEREHIRNTLQDTDWNISQTARFLNIDRVTLYRKIKKYKLKNR
jgi:Nif-specific regulatory protein